MKGIKIEIFSVDVCFVGYLKNKKQAEKILNYFKKWFTNLKILITEMDEK